MITIGKIEIDFSIIEDKEGDTSTGANDKKSDLIIGTKDENGTITVTNGKYTLQVGDYINYSPTDGVEATTIKSYDTETGYTTTNKYQEFSSNYIGKWRVLGISKEGQIVIVPENIIKTTENKFYYLQNEVGYKNAVDELDKISAIFANGYGATGKGRSIRVEDINLITGYNPVNEGKYDPEQTGSGTIYGAGDLNEYGNKFTYYWKGDSCPYYTYTKLDGTPGTPGSVSYSHDTFNWFDNIEKEWKSSKKKTLESIVTDGDTTKMQEIATLENNYYDYDLTSLNSSSGAEEGLISETKAYTTVYNGGEEWYWLASPYTYTNIHNAEFGVRRVYRDFVYGQELYYSTNKINTGSVGVRPVVYLKGDIQLTGNSTDGWIIVKN